MVRVAEAVCPPELMPFYRHWGVAEQVNDPGRRRAPDSGKRRAAALPAACP
ncbi:hypothetical protein ACTMSW_26140 [Micromonospora sp. BQ11]|uniref:hypothetical protein n=1 Tax=Micromonospora sp. BQ11 TaxID=3452212 RepID=UPI003F8C9E5D